jgi:hypothetical protein
MPGVLHRVPAAIPNFRHLEWFTDHARLEPLLVDGAPKAVNGAIRPNVRPRGHGMSIGDSAAEWCTA